jgi:hypothetical protein
MERPTPREQAEIELGHEAWLEEVAKEKVKLKTKKTLWERLFPWTITVKRR